MNEVTETMGQLCKRIACDVKAQRVIHERATRLARLATGQEGNWALVSYRRMGVRDDRLMAFRQQKSQNDFNRRA